MYNFCFSENRRGIALLAALTASSPMTWGQARFDVFEPLSSWEPTTTATTLSGDGELIGGYSGDQWNNHPLIFRRDGAVSKVPMPQGAVGVRGLAMSADGSRGIANVASGGLQTGYRWTSRGTTEYMPLSSDCFYSHVFAITASGRYVGGAMAGLNRNPVATIWDDQGGYTLIPPPEGTTSRMASYVVGLSEDAQVALGLLVSDPYDMAFRWKNGVTTALGTLPGGTWSNAWVMTPDGSRVFGDSGVAGNLLSGFSWTEETGMTPLAAPQGSDYFGPVACTPDGSILVGVAGFSGRDFAAISIANQAYTLKSYLSNQHGLRAKLTGWSLREANDVVRLADGRLVIAGYGIDPNGYGRGFVVTTPEPTTAVALVAGFGALLRRRARKH